MNWQVQGNVYYFFPKLSRKNVTNLNWFEFVPSQQVEPYWKISSAYISEDVMAEVDSVFYEVVPEFQYCGVTVISAIQAYALARRLRQLVDDLDAWLPLLEAEIVGFQGEQGGYQNQLDRSLSWYLREVRAWRSDNLADKQEISALMKQLARWIDSNVSTEKGMSIIGVLFGEKY